jgi:hypothetical protein
MKQIEINDILVSSGGWECTDATFFKVIKIMNGFLTIRQLESKVVSFEPFPGTTGSGTKIPTENFVNEELIRRKINFSNYNNEPYIVIQKSYYLSAHKWDGTPQQFDFRNI